MNLQVTTTFLISFVVALSAPSFGAPTTRAASDGETVYTKDIPGGRRLLVLKVELPKHEAKKDAQGKPITEPGVQWPEHSYEYTFVIQSADGVNRETLGKKWIGTLPGEVERMKFAILDALVYDDQLVVLYRAGRGTYGDTALVGAREGGFLMGALSPLVLDFVESGTWTIGGRLEGSPKAGSLRAIITVDVEGKTIDRRFLFVNKDGHYEFVQEPARPSKK